MQQTILVITPEVDKALGNILNVALSVGSLADKQKMHQQVNFLLQSLKREDIPDPVLATPENVVAKTSKKAKKRKK